MHCGSIRSVSSVVCVKKLRDFPSATDLLANHLAFVTQPGKTRGYVSKPAGSGGFKNGFKNARVLQSNTLLATAGSILQTSRNKQGKAGFVSGKRFDWSQAASTKTTPP